MLTELRLVRDLLSKYGSGSLAGIADALVGLKESDDPSVSPNQDEVKRDSLTFMKAFVGAFGCFGSKWGSARMTLDRIRHRDYIVITRFGGQS
jgi:hypothetical protein